MTAPIRTDPVAILEILLISLIATTLIFVQSPILGSDGFISGKALSLILASLAGSFVYVLKSRRFEADISDLTLLAILLLLGFSSLAAVNTWNAAVASSALVASIIIFWTARSISIPRYRSVLLFGVVGALGVAIGSALVEAYTPVQFSTRPPGGTIGNRNRMAHLIVIGAPALFHLTLRIRDRWILGLLLFASATAGAALLLSRARGAWLAALVVVFVAAVLIVLRTKSIGFSSHSTKQWKRLASLGSATMIGMAIALLLPNHLDWVSSNPYRDSAARLLDFRSGTGAGRVIEYRSTITMIGDHPILGVGPGNWRIAYPNYAEFGDPNIEPGYIPVRRFPQGEWVGGAAERGIPSLLLLFFFAGTLAWRWLRAVIRDRSHRRVGYAYIGLLTMIAVLMVGLFDPVIMTPTAGFVVPVVLGVCAAPFSKLQILTPPPWLRAALVSVALVGGLYLASFPAREFWSAMTYAKRPSLQAFERGARIAPGDYRAHFFAARLLVQRGDCANAASHIDAARRLYPTAVAAIQLKERCEAIPANRSSDSDEVTSDSGTLPLSSSKGESSSALNSARPNSGPSR